jgi:hypothetical protein
MNLLRFSAKGGTATLSESNTPALRIDEGFELSRSTNAGCHRKASGGVFWKAFFETSKVFFLYRLDGTPLLRLFLAR